jgi:hypothetical protein
MLCRASLPNRALCPGCASSRRAALRVGKYPVPAKNRKTVFSRTQPTDTARFSANRIPRHGQKRPVFEAQTYAFPGSCLLNRETEPMPAARETVPPNGARKGSRDGSNDAPVIGSAPQTRLFSGFSGTTSTQRQVPGVAGGAYSRNVKGLSLMAALRAHFGLCEPPHDRLKAGNCAKGINDWIWDKAASRVGRKLRLTTLKPVMHALSSSVYSRTIRQDVCRTRIGLSCPSFNGPRIGVQT